MSLLTFGFSCKKRVDDTEECDGETLRTPAKLRRCDSVVEAIGVDSGGGSLGTRPPIIRMRGKTPFLPPNNQMRISRKNLFKKINMKESRNREKERKIQRKGSKFVQDRKSVV